VFCTFCFDMLNGTDHWLGLHHVVIALVIDFDVAANVACIWSRRGLIIIIISPLPRSFPNRRTGRQKVAQVHFAFFRRQ